MECDRIMTPHDEGNAPRIQQNHFRRATKIGFIHANIDIAWIDEIDGRVARIAEDDWTKVNIIALGMDAHRTEGRFPGEGARWYIQRSANNLKRPISYAQKRHSI